MFMSGEGQMFAGGTDSRPRGLRRGLPISLTIHAILLIALFRGRTPIFIAPSSTLGGVNGTAITHLYWASGSAETDAGHSPDSSDRRDSRQRLIWKKAHDARKTPSREVATQDASTERQMASAAPAPSAGSPYGSLSEGSWNGHEIRPALPMTTFEPLVSPDDLRGGSEGNVVIEITIDEAGNIVNKTVVQSLGPAIDAKVLAALENWHFHPATRDGVPIPSKQDVVYHFKPR